MDRLDFARIILGASALCAIVSGCVTTESHRIPTYDSVIPIQGYLFAAGDSFVVEVFNTQLNAWEPLASGVSVSTVSIPANTISNNPDMFSFEANVQISSFDDPASFCRWSGGCLDPARVDRCIGAARVRVATGGDFARTFGAPGPPPMDQCIAQRLEVDSSFLRAAEFCKSEDSPELRFFVCPTL
ncbi:MAG: hypothetical protein RL033_4103 [Pseudomonadota bacterium]|jgi:hypothetical protein